MSQQLDLFSSILHHFFSHLDSPTRQEPSNLPIRLDLFLLIQVRHDELQDASHIDVVLPNQARVVDVAEESHEELAVEAVSQASVAWDRVSKVFDVEGSLEARGEETAKGSNQTGKGGHDERVELEGGVRDGAEGDADGRLEQRRDGLWQDQGVPQEDWVLLAVDLLEGVHTQRNRRARHVVEALEKRGPPVRKDFCNDKGAYKPFDGLLGTQRDERRLTPDHTADVSEDVVADDQGSRDKEPDETFEDVVDEEVAREDDEQQRHMDPAKETKLVLEILSSKARDEADEPNDVQQEAEESVVSGKGDEVRVDEDDVLEVVDEGLAVQEVVGDCEKVPGQRLGPQQLFALLFSEEDVLVVVIVARLCRCSETSISSALLGFRYTTARGVVTREDMAARRSTCDRRSTRDLKQGRHLAIDEYLQDQNEDDDVGMTHADEADEPKDHGKAKRGAFVDLFPVGSPLGLFLLGVVEGLSRWLRLGGDFGLGSGCGQARCRSSGDRSSCVRRRCGWSWCRCRCVCVCSGSRGSRL